MRSSTLGKLAFIMAMVVACPQAAQALPFHAAGYSYGTSGGFVLPDASASHYSDNQYPAKSAIGDMNDGKFVTVGGTPNPAGDQSIGWSTTSSGQITFDLGGRFTLDSLSIGHVGISTWAKAGPDDVQVSYSTDGVNFSAPVTVAGFQTFPLSSTYQRADLVLSAPVDASHVRLTFDGGAGPSTPAADGYLLDDVSFNGYVKGGVTPYANNDPDTFLLYHMNEAAGLSSASTSEHFIADGSGNNLHLRTNLSVTPLLGVAGPAGLGSAATSSNSPQQRMYRENTSLAGLNTETFTIEGWVRNPAEGTYAGLLRVDDDANGLLQFGTDSNGDQLRLAGFFNNASGTSQFQEYLSTETISFEEDVWYHIAVTYDNNGNGALDDSAITFYFDSVEDFGQPSRAGTQLGDTLTGVFDANPFGGTGDIWVGEWEGAYFLNGDIDEVRWSNVVRTEFNLAAVPEPGTWALGLAGALGMALLLQRRRIA